MLAMEICEPTYPSAPENNFNFEDQSLHFAFWFVVYTFKLNWEPFSSMPPGDRFQKFQLVFEAESALRNTLSKVPYRSPLSLSWGGYKSSCIWCWRVFGTIQINTFWNCWNGSCWAGSLAPLKVQQTKIAVTFSCMLVLSPPSRKKLVEVNLFSLFWLFLPGCFRDMCCFFIGWCVLLSQSQGSFPQKSCNLLLSFLMIQSCLVHIVFQWGRAFNVFPLVQAQSLAQLWCDWSQRCIFQDEGCLLNQWGSPTEGHTWHEARPLTLDTVIYCYDIVSKIEYSRYILGGEYGLLFLIFHQLANLIPRRLKSCDVWCVKGKHEKSWRSILKWKSQWKVCRV